MAEPLVTTVVFDTAAAPAASGGWHVSLQAWTYRAQDSRVRKATIAALLEQRYGLVTTPETQALFDRRINLLLANNTRGQRPVVRLGDHAYMLPVTRPNGHTRLDVILPAGIARPGTVLPVRRLDDPTPIATATCIAADGLSIISDIDDTVKETGVLDRAQLWRSTFYQPFKAVAGMGALLQRLGGSAAPVVHYVSSSPWHLYRPLVEWLRADGLPVTTLHLKHIRLMDRSIFDIVGSPQRHKALIIAALLQRWPQRRFILLGDSGEADPAVYALMARRFGGRVQRILIRRAPGDERTVHEIAAPFEGLSASSWQVFDHPEEVA